MHATMIEIDGSVGEGGGQIVRSSLALSLVTGTPVRIRNVRAKRTKPGLLRQHLTALRAAAEIGSAHVEGDELGSREIVFRPEGITAGSFGFAVGTAGSTTLVIQTILPALMCADGPSDVTIEGGTHNPLAPPFDFLQRVFLPVLTRMGVNAQVTLERPGFYPAGGGRVRLEIQPATPLRPIDLLERGGIRERRVEARVANLHANIAERELATIKGVLSWDDGLFRAVDVPDARGPGNVVTVEIEAEHITELFTSFGRPDARAERVGNEVAQAARRYVAADVPVGPHLADQLLIPMAMAGRGSFRTMRPTRHCYTNTDVVKAFLDCEIDIQQEDRDQWRIDISSRAGTKESDHEG